MGCRGGTVEDRALLLRQPGPDPNAKVTGNALLYGASGSHNLDTVKALLQAAADPNIASVASRSELTGSPIWCKSWKLEHFPSHRICGLDRYSRAQRHDSGVEEELFSALVEAGIDIHRQEQKGRMPLHGAVNSSPALTRLLLGAGADATNSKGRTPLHMEPSGDTMKLLFQLGHPDINQKDNDGQSPSTAYCRPPGLARTTFPSFWSTERTAAQPMMRETGRFTFS